MTHYDVAPLPGYESGVGLLLASLADSTREWREELGEPSIEAITWQPAPGMHSIGAELLHIADVEVYWLECFAAGRPRDPEELKLLLSEETNQDEGIWPTPPAEPIQWYFDLHDRLRKRAWEAVREIEPKRVYERRSNSFTFGWILAHVVEHDSYHGGQAVLLHELWKKLHA